MTNVIIDMMNKQIALELDISEETVRSTAVG
jgi:FixJ family two-component response regulator